MHRMRALELYQAQQYSEAIQAASSAARHYQDCSDLSQWAECENLAGLCHLALNQLSQASAHFSQAQTLYGQLPDSSEVRIWQGRSLYHQALIEQQRCNPGGARNLYHQAEELLGPLETAQASAAACAQNLSVVCNELYEMQEAV